MAVGDVWRVAVQATIHAQLTINTFYYQHTAGGAIADITTATSLVNAILGSAWWPFYLDMHSAEWVATVISPQRISDGDPTATLTPTYNIDIVDAPGTTGGGSLPSSMAFVIRRRTNLPGRRGYGRIYLTGFPLAWENDSIANLGVPAFVTAISGFIANANADLVNGANTWSPRHYAAKNTLTRATPIRQWAYDLVLRNQRRRQIGVGM